MQPYEGSRMEYVDTEQFLASSQIPVVDVRSPKEFEEGHIVHAHNLPLLENHEREIVGTIYKAEGSEAAVEKGYELVNPRREEILAKARGYASKQALRVYCWRGGLRSQKMAELFESAGISCRVLEGGYKAFRSNLRVDFSRSSNWLVLMGMTGSGKTALLQELKDQGEQILDLEFHARHRGSAFGSLGMSEQPSTAQFQNELYHAFAKLDPSRRIWVECESYNIGQVYLPEGLWEQMLVAPAIEVLVEREKRVDRLVKEYGAFSILDLELATGRIERRLGSQKVDQVKRDLRDGDLHQVASTLLEYYDKSYFNSLKRFQPTQKKVVQLNAGQDRDQAQQLIQAAIEMGIH